MALDDYLESEVVVAVAATAAVLSPRVRKVLRRGAVYGIAGVLRAGDVISSTAPAVSQGAQQAAASAASTVQDVAGQARAAAEGGEDAQPQRSGEPGE